MKNQSLYSPSRAMRSLLGSCAARGSAALRTAHANRLPSSSKKQQQPASGSGGSGGSDRGSSGSSPRLPIGAAPTSPSSPSPPSTSAATPSTPPSSSSDREHPVFPRVGVAAVLFRPRTGESEDSEPSLLLIRRAKAPNEGLWSFPGGALELGEPLVAGAERELGEEVPGLEFEREGSVAGELAGGVAFAAADSIHYDGGGGADGGADGGGEKRGGGERESPPPRFHWAIVEVAAVAKSSSASGSGPSLRPSAPPPPTADDASGSRWVGALSELRRLEERGEVTRGCARVAAEAVRRFGKDLRYRESS